MAETPVIIRVGTDSGDSEPIAVFVSHRAYGCEEEMESYAVEEGWGSRSVDWFENHSRPATDKEEAPLVDVVSRMGFYRTKFYKRRSKVHRALFEDAEPGED